MNCLLFFLVEVLFTFFFSWSRSCFLSFFFLRSSFYKFSSKVFGLVILTFGLLITTIWQQCCGFKVSNEKKAIIRSFANIFGRSELVKDMPSIEGAVQIMDQQMTRYISQATGCSLNIVFFHKMLWFL